MAERIPLDDIDQFSVWTDKRMPRPRGCRRVAIAHHDHSVAHSLALLLQVKGCQCQYASDLAALEWLVQSWDPHAVLLDTWLVAGQLDPIVRSLATSAMGDSRFLLALSDCWGQDDRVAMAQAGFDGHLRRPCPVWRLADTLDTYFRMR